MFEFLKRALAPAAEQQATVVQPVPMPGLVITPLHKAPTTPEQPVFQTELTEADYQHAATRLRCSVAHIKAVVDVESSGEPGALLFEAHIFHRQTNGRFAGVVDSRGVAISVPRWDKTLYGKTAWQEDRLACAAALDREAALKSASWGLFQVMGFNYASCGYGSVDAFVAAIRTGAPAQLDAFIAFVETQGLAGYLRDGNWRLFTRGYNGSGQVNYYASRLEEAYRRHAGLPPRRSV